MSLHRRLSALALAAILATPALAAADATPAAPAPRAMVTDRPSKTDGPFTLDAGRTQLEFEIFTHTRDAEAGVNTRALSLGSTFVRWGATSQLELQLGWQTYARVTVDEAGATTRAAGFGDTVLRAKYNFFGNDGGATALALLPFAKIPTNQGGLGNRAVEPGVSLPFTANLPAGWQLGLMTKWSRLLNGDGRGRHDFWEWSSIAGHSLTEKLSAYGELWTGRSGEAGAAAQSSAGLGLGYALTADSCLDISVNLALNRATPDLAFSCGYSMRL
jgi:hypothetical protein